jgi:antitoxin PrlF
MNIQRGKIVSGGRIQLPVDVRRALSLSDGDTVLIEVVDGEVHLRPVRAAIKRMQERMRPYIIEGASVVDELIADRRREAADE